MPAAAAAQEPAHHPHRCSASREPGGGTAQITQGVGVTDGRGGQHGAQSMEWPDANPDQDGDDGQNDQATCSSDRAEDRGVRDQLQGQEAHQ
jgi:hypothetical protein